MLNFLAGILFILLAVLTQHYFFYQNDHNRIKDDFLSVLHKKEIILKDHLQKLKTNYFSIPDSSKISFHREFQKLYKEESISFFIYDRDSLIYWSSNYIPVSDNIFSKTQLTPEIIKLQNGWYEIFSDQDSSRTFFGLILLQHQYPFQNDFLTNSFEHGFRVPDGTVIVSEQKGNGLTGKGRSYNIDLQFPEKIPLTEQQVFLLFILYFIALLFLLTSIYFIYKQLEHVYRYKWLLIPGYIIDVLLVRFFIFHFKVPSSVYDSPLFGPDHFSSSYLLPSLGDFLVNSILLLLVAYIFFLHFPRTFNLKGKGILQKSLHILLLFSIAVIGFLFSLAVIKELVLNSTIPLTLQNISNLTVYSLIAFIIISAVIVSCLLVFFRLSGFYSARNFGFALLLMALSATFCLNHYNDRIEREKRKLLSVRLSLEGDPLVEMLFSRIEKDLLCDSLLRNHEPQRSGAISNLQDDSISARLLTKYFGESWNNYMVQITICRPDKILFIQPQNYQLNCETYFQNIIRDFAKPVSGKNLYFLDYGYGVKNYLAVIPFDSTIGQGKERTTAYIEINSKLLFKDLGYPELLIDKNKSRIPDISGYSYAFFRNGKLIHRVGNIQYSLDLDHADKEHSDKDHFYSRNGTDNFCHPIDKSNYLIISKKAGTFLDSIAPFPYLFFLFLVFSLLFFICVRFPLLFKVSQIRLSERLEISMTGILIISLLVVGVLFVFYITSLNRDKNLENLSERTHSIYIEMQHKFGMADDLSDRSTGELNELLTKFSNVFFSDINLYSPSGRLIGTSRPEIFEKGFISTLINNAAFSDLRYNHSNLFIHDEAIGSHQYSSAYMPVYNDRNVLLGYLNLPYFARQDDLKREISTFLMAFINIYVSLIIFGFFVALIVSNYITRPLRLLTLRLGNLTFGKSNEKLEWKRNDEVGRLVEEYNRKIDELAKSAEMLAQSERESAWREMARQIAHEIKNPLTPMKLSVQFLLKSWEEKSGDWEQRINRFTATMIEQIDSLSFIASEFSDFARMPDPKNERLNLNEIIRITGNLYKNIANISIVIESEDKEAMIIADHKQLIRVFTNLFNNAVEAIGEEKTGLIRIQVKTCDNRHFITITDNGSGIPPEQAAKIFQPNFTTKSGGMGLGLAIVKNIIVSSGGEIGFESEAEKGTVFTISFPASK